MLIKCLGSRPSATPLGTLAEEDDDDDDDDDDNGDDDDDNGDDDDEDDDDDDDENGDDDDEDDIKGSIAEDSAAPAPPSDGAPILESKDMQYFPLKHLNPNSQNIDLSPRHVRI